MSKKFLSPIKLAQGTSTPSTGSSGELFYNTTDSKIYTHNGTAWVASGGGVTNSATIPSNPSNGDAWFNTNEGTLFIYYSDGTSSQWVEATAPKQGVESYQLPAGSIMAWGGSVAPTNWLIADGSAISRTTYASLFAAIGTTYGVGDGSTTFNLPDFRGRIPVGKNAATFGTLGATGGSETHVHGSSGMTAGAYVGYWATRSGASWTATNSGGFSAPGGSTTTGTNATAIFGNTDSGSSLQPYQVVNYIIKYSAGEAPGDSELATRVGTLETSARPVELGGTGVVSGTGTVPVIPSSLGKSGGTATATSTGTVSFSSTTYIDLFDAFSSSYDDYLVYINITTSTDTNSPIMIQFGDASTISAGTSYAYHAAYVQNASVGSFSYSGGSAGGFVGQLGTYTAGRHPQTSITIFKPQQAALTEYVFNSNSYYGGNDAIVWGGGFQGGVTQFTRLRVISGGGNAITGTVKVLGIR